MISKKVAATLGAGAMGAAGAGTLGAKLLNKGKGEDKTVVGNEKTPTTWVAKTSFASSSSADEMAIALVEKWESRSSNPGLVIIEIKEGGEVKWECTLKPILIGYGSGAGNIQTLQQWQDVEREVKNDESKRKKFVENCSGSRVSEEKAKGEASTIELEAAKEQNVWKFKNLEKLWTENYRGLERMDGENLKIYQSTNWEIKEGTETVEKTKKITVTATYSGSEKWSCSISGTSGTDLISKTFKKKELEDILKMETMNPDSEKRKYLIRNCLKRNKEITGLTIQTVGNNKWEFSDLKKITEGMYVNPI